jgi:hypothetical protein
MSKINWSTNWTPCLDHYFESTWRSASSDCAKVCGLEPCCDTLKRLRGMLISLRLRKQVLIALYGNKAKYCCSSASLIASSRKKDSFSKNVVGEIRCKSREFDLQPSCNPSEFYTKVLGARGHCLCPKSLVFGRKKRRSTNSATASMHKTVHTYEPFYTAIVY